MQCHSPTKVPHQVTSITTFRSNKCSMHDKFPRFLIAIPSYCRAVLGSRGSFNGRKFKPTTLPFDPYHLITRRRAPILARDPCSSMIREIARLGRIKREHGLISVEKESIAKALKRNAIRGSISPFVDSRVARDFSLPEKQRAENDGA